MMPCVRCILYSSKPRRVRFRRGQVREFYASLEVILNTLARNSHLHFAANERDE